MIDYESLFARLDEYREEFFSGVFEYVVIDNFLKEGEARRICGEFPDPIKEKIGRSRDYVFAKNKFEKSNLRAIGDGFKELYDDILSDDFAIFLKKLTGEDVFVDPGFHGGGIHQGGEGSYLNMHADFNYHPARNDWFRNLNILIYFNESWRTEYGGQLKLRNKNNGDQAEVEPIYNRCVIMFTRDYTLHGYDRINFPKGSYRRSVAAYAYSSSEVAPNDVRSTTWYPEDGGKIKRLLGKNWPKIVAMKTRIFGSSTVKNK